MTENWILHKKEGNINAENEFIRQIIERLGKDVSESFYSLKSPITKPGERTTKLFEVLTLMGDEKGYKVYSHSLSENFMKEHKNEKGEPKFVNREWFKGGKTKSTRLVESGEVAKSLCYSRMRAIFSS